MSTIASEDAEEEQKALTEDRSLDIGEDDAKDEDEAKTPTESVPADATREEEVSVVAEAVVPENEQGDSLLEKVAQSLEAVVVAAEETLLGTGEVASTAESASEEPATTNSLVEEDGKPEIQPLSTEQLLAPGADAEPSPATRDPQDAGLEGDSATTNSTEPTVPTESIPVADPTYTIAIVGNKYNTQNFW